MTNPPARKGQAEVMLSLVIFFTQSISLSNISQTPARFAGVHPEVDLSSAKAFTCRENLSPRKAQSPNLWTFRFEQETRPLTNLFKNSKNLVELTGIEPVTPCLQSRCSPS